MELKWHYTKDNDYPELFGEYAHKVYPQIPCLVFYRGTYMVRWWNIEEKCWDDEECDDYFCDKDGVEKWLYIDALEKFIKQI